ncbi:unnamed protein product, partial [Chrysoparadoxa australica]
MFYVHITGIRGIPLIEEAQEPGGPLAFTSNAFSYHRGAKVPSAKLRLVVCVVRQGTLIYQYEVKRAEQCLMLIPGVASSEGQMFLLLFDDALHAGQLRRRLLMSNTLKLDHAANGA